MATEESRFARPLCSPCGPGYRVGDPGCNHSPLTGDETRGEAEVDALTSALGDIRVEDARKADWWTSDEEHALLIRILRGECRVWAEGLLRSDWLAARDRARDAEVRRVAIAAFLAQLPGDLFSETEIQRVREWAGEWSG